MAPRDASWVKRLSDAYADLQPPMTFVEPWSMILQVPRGSHALRKV